MKNKKGILNLTRRRFIQSSSLVGLGSVTGCATIKPNPIQRENPLVFDLFRVDDHFYARLEAWNFELIEYKKKKYLVPTCACKKAILVFIFPPQIYTETAIPIEDDVSSLLDSNPQFPERNEKLLENVQLVPGKEARLVFRVPNEIKMLELSLEELLRWNQFDYLVEDFEELKDISENGRARRHFIGFDWENDKNLKYSSSIDLPWGVFLQPLGKHKDDFIWRHLTQPKTISGRTELWFSALENTFGRSYPLQFEVLDVKGFKHKGSDPISRTTYFDEIQEYKNVKNVIECSAVTNYDRLEIAASLSRRFEYTGQADADPKKTVNTESLEYIIDGVSISKTNACYVPGRSIDVKTFGISSLGGWIDFESEWNPRKGCALKGWSHNATFGREHRVPFQRTGYLYPFGVPAELVIVTEREFAKDKYGHYVAPLIKRAFIQIPQPNLLEINHGESPFVSLSITTRKTPPLDLPASGNFIDYAICDYFEPKVDGVPFKFEHLGIDHAGQEVFSAMSMYFVSNKAVGANGLIPEKTAGANKPYSPRIPKDVSSRVNCGPTTEPNSPPASCKNFNSGLRELDREWLGRDYRFVTYSSNPVALAPTKTGGKTTQELAWVEWVRGQVPDPSEYEHNIAPIPFIPRARTLKISLQGISQFSGQKNYMLATYRDTRFKGYQILDPEPDRKNRDEYSLNVLTKNNQCNDIGAYLSVLPIDTIQSARTSTTNDQARIKAIRHRYFPPSLSPLSVELFEYLENEISFGRNNTTDSLGGISTPDAPIGLLTTQQGPLGDNVFDNKKWFDKRGSRTPKIPDNREYYWEFRKSPNPSQPESGFYDGLIDGLYDDLNRAGTYPLCESLRNLKGSSQTSSQKTSSADITGLDDIASLFGMDAEIIPGIRLTKVLEGVGLDIEGVADTAYIRNQHVFASGNKGSRAPKWDYKITGLEEVLALFGDGPGQITLDDAVDILSKSNVIDEPGMPLEFGIQASLEWSTSSFNQLDLGVVDFKPGDSSYFSINASTSIDFLEGNPKVSARAALYDFNVIVFQSLDINFENVSFSLDEHGNKKFDPKIGTIDFTGALSFINNLKSMLKSLEDQLGIRIDLKPAAITVSQVIAIPPASDPSKPGGSFLLGPVLVSNLNIWWGVRIPLLGRDVLTVSFGLATREDPLTVYIPPYMGGKSHALMEVTTNGLRLFEVSIEFGGMIRVDYSMATGEVSSMAGNYFMIANVERTKTFMLQAYVKVSGEMQVAGFIDVSLVILISLTYEKTTGSQCGGEKIAGEASITVSVKVCGFRVSYSFTAREEQKIAGGCNSSPENIYNTSFADSSKQVQFERQGFGSDEDKTLKIALKDKLKKKSCNIFDESADQVYLFSKGACSELVWAEFIGSYAADEVTI